MPLTQKDLQKIENILDPRFVAIKTDLGRIEGKADKFLKSADDFISKAKKTDDEVLVLRAQQKQIKHVLIVKNIASEQDLSVV